MHVSSLHVALREDTKYIRHDNAHVQLATNKLDLYDQFHWLPLLRQTVIPFFVATTMSRIKHTNALVVDADYYARSAVATIGVQKFTFGCLSHSIQV